MTQQNENEQLRDEGFVDVGVLFRISLVVCGVGSCCVVISLLCTALANKLRTYLLCLVSRFCIMGIILAFVDIHSFLQIASLWKGLIIGLFE